MLSFQDPHFFSQLPTQASTFGTNIDNLFMFVWWVCAFFFFLIVFVLFYSAIKFRRVREDQAPETTVTHNTTLEIVWTIIPLVIVMVIFAWGFDGGKDMLVAPGDAHNVRVEAYQWGWDIYHPNAGRSSGPELWVPLGENVKLTTSSRDVLHSFFIPAFRVKRDVLPGRNQVLWFNATQLGDFPILCTEYCGDSHSQMRGTVHVITREEWDKQPWNKDLPPVEMGQLLYSQKCASCHTVDGKDLVGPSFKGLWGREGKLETGESYAVDDAYFLESIRYPEAKRVAGYTGKNMTPWPENLLSDEDVEFIKTYIKTLE